MPRRARIAPGEIVYHALNRANDGTSCFIMRQRWLDRVDGAQTACELAALRQAVNRGTPYGSEDWMMRIANRLQQEFTFHGRGRPRRKEPCLIRKGLRHPVPFSRSPVF